MPPADRLIVRTCHAIRSDPNLFTRLMPWAFGFRGFSQSKSIEPGPIFSRTHSKPLSILAVVTDPISQPRKRPTKLLKWATLSALVIFILVGVCSSIFGNQKLIYRENGILEVLSVMVWSVSAILAFRAAFLRTSTTEHRFLAFFLGTVALLAALREVDAHIWLNPKRLGDLGVRYKINWWLDSNVSLILKLGWALVFLTLACSVLYPLTKSWRTLSRSLLARETVPLLVLASMVFLGMGFALDDLLRHSSRIAPDARKLLEETAEALGGALYLIAVIVHSRKKALSTR